MNLQKPKRYESEKYKEFIRDLPCCACNVNRLHGRAQSDPHHMRSKGAGGSDLTCIPLCRKHHTEIHWSSVKFQVKYIIDLKDIQIKFFALTLIFAS